MKTVSLSGSLRENVGKKDAKALRKSEMVPCVLYGGDEQIHFATEAKNFKKLLFTPECFIINVTIDGKSYNTILQDVQYHPVTDNVLHADFLLVKDDKPITVVLPIAIEGSAPGVIRGGKLKQAIRKIKVSGLAKDIPEIVTVNISNLNILDAIRVRDINIDGVTMVTPGYQVIVEVRAARGASASTEEETEE
ncbi:MAG: 50S ribosomal protein L25/general stress protein Ctc [Bacteroidales bacterium]|nr:50S ribosomal protein L25/general stress protein Ctc [Bacteroidales bacterium]